MSTPSNLALHLLNRIVALHYHTPPRALALHHGTGIGGGGGLVLGADVNRTFVTLQWRAEHYPTGLEQ